jgi:hypothetical protein
MQGAPLASMVKFQRWFEGGGAGSGSVKTICAPAAYVQLARSAANAPLSPASGAHDAAAASVVFQQFCPCKKAQSSDPVPAPQAVKSKAAAARRMHP